MTMTAEAPDLFEVVALNKDGHEHLPEPTVPYYVVSDEGHYLHKRTQIGDALLRDTSRPKLAKLGHAGGIFTWRGPKVPATIISQAHDFFARIFDTKHAEAEVIITKHVNTEEFRLFVPYQRVSHMGVKSIFEPTHISSDWMVVGTLHSHCDFGAFHSGTDTGDASDMDGVHFTIGKVNTPTPEIAAMVMMNAKQFDYPPEDIAEVGYRTTTSPTWWDRFVFAEGDAPKEKPAGLTSLTQEHWDEFLGRTLRTPKTKLQPWQPTKTTPIQHSDWTKDWRKSNYRWSPREGYDYAPPPSGPESPDDWRRRVYGAGPSPSNSLLPLGGEFNDLSNLITDKRIDAALDLAERAGVFTDYDWDETKEKDVNVIAYWQGFFENRLMATVEVLKLLGIDKTKPPGKQRGPKR